MAAIGRLSKRLKGLYTPYFSFSDSSKVGRAIVTKPSRSRLLSPLQVTFIEKKELLDGNDFRPNSKSEIGTPYEVSRKFGRYQDNHYSIRSRRTYRKDTYIDGGVNIAKDDAY